MRLKTLLLYVTLLGLPTCYSLSNAQHVSGAQSFRLTNDELKNYERLASDGDADAAFLLYKYYAYGRNDLNTASLWLKKSADLGSQSAMTSMANKYINEGNLKEAKKYMKSSMKTAYVMSNPCPRINNPNTLKSAIALMSCDSF